MRLCRIAGDPPRWARLTTDESLRVYEPACELADILSLGTGLPTEEAQLADVTLAAPVDRPGKVVCVGVNYLDHCRETDTEPPAEPLLFAKFPSVISGPDAVVSWSSDLTSQVDYEAEMVVMIGKECTDVSEENALDHVAGYMCGNDLSARDLQFGDGQWIRGKNLEGFCALGPFLTSADEIDNPQALSIECRVNGNVMQSSATTEMIFGVAEIISYCSRHFALEPGDLIMTGTPHGVALGRSPSPWLVDGDTVEVTIAGLGTLTSYCETS